MSFPESCGLSDFLASLDGGLAAGDLGRLGLLGLIDGLGAEVLLDGAEQHDEADAADDAEHDLETEDARVGIDALGVDEAAVPGVDEHVGHDSTPAAVPKMRMGILISESGELPMEKAP